MPKHHELIEDDTFAIPPNCIARVQKRGKFMGIFSFTYHYAMEKYAVDNKDGARTLVFIMSLPNHENIVFLDTGLISEKLSLTRAAVQQHIASLRKCGIIIPHEDVRPNAKPVLKWRLCPFLGWKGTAVSLEKYLNSLPINHPFFNYADPEWIEAIKEEIENEKLECEL